MEGALHPKHPKLPISHIHRGKVDRCGGGSRTAGRELKLGAKFIYF